MDADELDEVLGIDLRNPSDRLARILGDQDEALVDRLVELRKTSGKSQQDIANAMAISQSAVARIEAGNRDPHLSILRRYAHAVGAIVTHTVERFDPEAEDLVCSTPGLIAKIEKTAHNPRPVPGYKPKPPRGRG